MAFTLNNISYGSLSGFAVLTLHETVSGKNKVVHVVVPEAPGSKMTPTARKRSARSLAKAALQDAAAVL